MNSSLITKEIEWQVQILLEENGALWPEQLRVILNHPNLLEHGDYSSNIAMLLAKIIKQSPIQIANILKNRLEENGSIHGLCKIIAVAAPGFLNLTIDWKIWEQLRGAQVKLAPPAAATKVIIEHTSINPNKSAHIGHLRNSCIGDTLSRMLAFAGHQVEVHNYIDDLGNQLADTVVGILQAPSAGKYERFGDFCWDTYANVNKVYQEDNKLQEERIQVLHALEAGDSNTAWLGTLIAERIVREQLEEMKLFGIDYNVLVWESSIVNEGFWTATFELLKQTHVFQLVTEGKQAGCWVLKHQEEQGAAEEDEAEHQLDKVLVRSNGILTYTAKDIAYHMWKFGLLDRDFTYKKFHDGLWSTHAGGIRKKIGHADVVINVIDFRQEYPQAVVKQALAALGFTEQANQLKHVSYGVVSLSPETAAGLGIDISSGKHAYAMSGRQGIGIKVAELVEHMEQIIEAKRSRKVGISSRILAAAAIRYYLLKVNIQTEVVFDLQQATEVSGNSGIYLLYSYARANRVLANAVKHQLIVDTTTPINLAELEPQEYELLRHIAYWEETFEAALKQLTPHVLCSYAFELASLFSHFYGACPIIKGPENKLQLRLWLTSRFKETLHQALQVLGMPTPKRM